MPALPGIVNSDYAIDLDDTPPLPGLPARAQVATSTILQHENSSRRSRLPSVAGRGRRKPANFFLKKRGNPALAVPGKNSQDQLIADLFGSIRHFRREPPSAP